MQMTRIALTDSQSSAGAIDGVCHIYDDYMKPFPELKGVATDVSYYFGFLETIDLHMIALPGAPLHLSRQAIRERYNWSTTFVWWETCIPHYIITKQYT